MPDRIYWFAFYDLRSPSVRYRGYHVLRELELNKNIRTHFFSPSWKLKSIFRFMWLVLSVHLRSRRNTRVVVQRIHSNGIYARVLKFLVKANKSICFYDLDDAQYVECNPKTIHWFLRNVKGVFVGSSALESYCDKFNDNVILLTSGTTHHDFQKTERNELFTIGWIGNFWGQHERNMYELFLPSLKQIHRPIKLEVLGVVHDEKEEALYDFFSDHDNISLSIPKNVNWQNDSEIYRMVSTYDIGVSPLLDTEINRCKSAYKLKQYLSCGVPVVGSAIGENSRFIQERRNGFICGSYKDFTRRISEFQDMSCAEYARYSKEAAESTVEFNISVVANAFYELLKTD